MVKLRISSDDPREVEDVIRLFESLFPDMRFTAARMGSNPKYADDPKYFSYGEPRVRNKKPIPINFKLVGKRLLNTPAPATKPAPTKPAPIPKKVTATAKKPAPATKPTVPDWQKVLELDGVAKLTWAKCRARYRDLTCDDISQATRDRYTEAMEAAARHFKISL